MALGWDVHDVHGKGLAGAVDAMIRAACEAEDRLLLTLDMEFAGTSRYDPRRYDPSRSLGVIVLRPRDQSITAVEHGFDAAVRALAQQRIRASLWIVEPERLRIRDHPTGA